jgi:hypothetical protein
MANDRSRYELVSRRALLKGAAVAGTLAFAPGLACSKDDKDAFSSTSATTAPGTTAAPGTTVAPGTTAAAGTTTSAKTATTQGGTTGGATLPASAKMAINFTFSPTGSGHILNPYVAVWIEDSSGALLRTVGLWIKADKTKYVNDLKRWYSVDRARIAKGGTDTMMSVSSATKVAGAYSVVWDAKNDKGAPVAPGSYFVCIEAAREHGPYELIREQVTLGASPLTKALADNGELTGASVSFTV